MSERKLRLAGSKIKEHYKADSMREEEVAELRGWARKRVRSPEVGLTEGCIAKYRFPQGHCKKK